MVDHENEREEPTFAELFEADPTTPDKHFQPGDTVSGEVVKISGENIFVDLGGKSPEYVWTRILTLAGEGRSSVVGLANIGGAGLELMQLLERKGKAA